MPAKVSKLRSRARQPQSRSDNKSRRARILLVDDNAEFLALVKDFLSTGFDVIGTLPDGETLLEKVDALSPEIIVLDISMKELSGIECAKILRKRNCPAKIIFLSVIEEAQIIRAALAIGAGGYVVKSRINSDLIPAIEAVQAESVYVSRTI